MKQGVFIGPSAALNVVGAVLRNINANFFRVLFIENAERLEDCTWKNDDYVLKNGHLFCNSR